MPADGFNPILQHGYSRIRVDEKASGLVIEAGGLLNVWAIDYSIGSV